MCEFCGIAFYPCNHAKKMAYENVNPISAKQNLLVNDTYFLSNGFIYGFILRLVYLRSSISSLTFHFVLYSFYFIRKFLTSFF